MTLLLKNPPDILYFDTVQSTSIFKGNPETVMLLESASRMDKDTCCMAVVNEGAHWVLIVIVPWKKTLIYLNPLGEIPSVRVGYLRKWFNFLHQRYRNGLEPSQPDSWSVVSETHAKQTDNISCGVFTLMFLRNT